MNNLEKYGISVKDKLYRENINIGYSSEAKHRTVNNYFTPSSKTRHEPYSTYIKGMHEESPVGFRNGSSRPLSANVNKNVNEMIKNLSRENKNYPPQQSDNNGIRSYVFKRDPSNIEILGSREGEDKKKKPLNFDTFGLTNIYSSGRPVGSSIDQKLTFPDRKVTKSSYLEDPVDEKETTTKRQNELLESLYKKLMIIRDPISQTEYSSIKNEVFYGSASKLQPRDKQQIQIKEKVLERLKNENEYLLEQELQVQQTIHQLRDYMDKSNKLPSVNITSLKNSLIELENKISTVESQGTE